MFMVEVSAFLQLFESSSVKNTENRHGRHGCWKMLESIFSPEEVAVFNGEKEVAQALLTLPFNHIHFTGSSQVGKVVMRAAAEHLASVTLEMGGKSPVIIDETAQLENKNNISHHFWTRTG